MTIYKWSKPPFCDMPTLDTPLGRYVLKRLSKGSREYRAWLNDKRTSFSGTLGQVMTTVERAVRSNVDINAKFDRGEG